MEHKKSPAISAAITAALKTFTEEEIREAITNYKTILDSPKNYWLTYKWTLITFLSQKEKNSIETFLTRNDPFVRYGKKLTRGQELKIHNEKMMQQIQNEENNDGTTGGEILR